MTMKTCALVLALASIGQSAIAQTCPRYDWKPQPDIELRERILARPALLALTSGDNCELAAVVEALPPEVKRHFVIRADQ